MEGRVDVALALGLAPVVLDACAQRRAPLLEREGQDHGVAARRRRRGGGGEVVRHHDVRARRAARCGHGCRCPPGSTRSPAASISRRALKLLAQRDDALAPDTHVAADRVGGGDDRAAANREIELHGVLLRPARGRGLSISRSTSSGVL